MKTASSEIRTIVVKAYDAGISRQQLAAIVGYHLNSVSRWIREFERENRLEAHPRGHRGSIFSEDERRELVEVIGKQPDITLEELRSRFAKACSLPAIHKLLKSLGLTFKKTPLASEQRREDIIRARAEWAEFQKMIDPNRLIFLDEPGVKTTMTRLYGRAPQGERCHDSAPNGHWEAVTVLSSIRLDGATEGIVFEGAVDKKMFDE